MANGDVVPRNKRFNLEVVSSLDLYIILVKVEPQNSYISLGYSFSYLLSTYEATRKVMFTDMH